MRDCHGDGVAWGSKWDRTVLSKCSAGTRRRGWEVGRLAVRLQKEQGIVVVDCLTCDIGVDIG